MIPGRIRRIRLWLRNRAQGIFNKALGTEQEHWARVVMNSETIQIVRDLNPDRVSALEISGDRWRTLVPFKRYENISYPSYDLCNGPLPDNSYDLIIAEQVFEHLPWPIRAGKNVYAMLRPGGHFLMTTPFLLRIHKAPLDCYRWTETGLGFFLQECGFDSNSIRTGSWGNRSCIKANMRKWILYSRRIHTLRNEPDFPVVVWAIAQRKF